MAWGSRSIAEVSSPLVTALCGDRSFHFNPGTQSLLLPILAGEW